MILINDNWEEVRDLQDISNIIREHYNYHLADKLDEFLSMYEDHYELECELEELHSEMYSLEDELSVKESEVEELEDKITELEDKISELEETIAELESQ